MMWLAQVICERCYLIQGDSISKADVLAQDDAEYACGCERCGHFYARYILI